MGHDDMKMWKAIEDGNVTKVSRIFSLSSINPHEVDKSTGNNFLHSAVYFNHEKVVDALIKQLCSSGVNHTNKSGRTPLFGVKSAAIATKLLESGAQPNVKDENGDTPLHFVARKTAAFKGGPIEEKVAQEIIRVLLKASANPSMKNKAGQTPVDVAASNEIKVMLHLAAESFTQQRAPFKPWLDSVRNNPALLKILSTMFLKTAIMDLEILMEHLQEEVKQRDDNPKLLCSICKNNRRDTLFNCQHLGSCSICAPNLASCPVCGMPVVTKQRICHAVE